MLALGTAALLFPAPLRSQDVVEAEFRIVASDGETALARARVKIRPGAEEAWTDPNGIAVLALPLGTPVTVEVTRIGYEPASRLVHVRRSGETITLAMAPAPIQLHGVQVTAPRRSAWLTEFERRRARYPGATFFGPEEMGRMHLNRFSDLFRRVSGANVTCRGSQCQVTMRRSACPAQFFLDGVRVVRMNPDDLPAADVEAVEVYRGAAMLPPELNSGTAGCGAIVVWTRDPRDRTRR